MANPTRSLSPFVSSKTISVPASGAVQRMNITGSLFYCKSATVPFQMRMNNGEWFDFDVAFFFDLEDEIFTTVEFRAASGATQDSTVVFFVASRQVGTHMNINASITSTSNLVNVLSSCAVETEIHVQANCAAPATDYTLAAAGTYFRRVTIIAQKDDNGTVNAGKVYLSNAANKKTILLNPGDTWEISADTGGKRDLGAWHIQSDNAGDGVSILGC